MQRRKETAAKILFWLPAILWVAAVILLSRQSAADSSRLSGSLTEFLLRVFPGIELSATELEPILRKLAHAAMFAVEGLLLCIAAGKSFGRRPGAALAAGISALLAVGSELVQTIADGRSCELRDMGIDFGGALLGIAAGLLLMLFIDKLSRRRVTNQR